jgi:hypothetical protein
MYGTLTSPSTLATTHDCHILGASNSSTTSSFHRMNSGFSTITLMIQGWLPDFLQLIYPDGGAQFSLKVWKRSKTGN